MVTVDTTPITVTDVDCSRDEVVTLPPAISMDGCGGAPVISNDAPGTFPAGQSTTVTYNRYRRLWQQQHRRCPRDRALWRRHRHQCQQALRGLGKLSGSTKEPFVGIVVGGYDKSEGSCARVTCGGISHQHYQCIVDSCQAVNTCTTDANGECTLNLPPGDYIVISADATKTVLPDPLGVSASDLLCGELKQKHLQQIVKADGKKVSGKTSRRTGSELLIIEPEFVEWSQAQELYPFVFESVGDWSTSTEVTPPEGFVTDYQNLSEQVTNEIEAVQFTLTDIGSDWIPTRAKHVLGHKGRREVVLSRIGVRLSKGLSQQKGVGRFGDLLVQTPSAEIIGWAEPIEENPNWTVKLRVNETTDLTLEITRGAGQIEQTLANGTFTAGEYEFSWNSEDLSRGRYFLSLTAGDSTEWVILLDM